MLTLILIQEGTSLTSNNFQLPICKLQIIYYRISIASP